MSLNPNLYTILSEASEPTQVTAQYVWGARPGHRDELILRDRAADRLYCLMDYFDPTAVIDPAGAVVERYGWSAFGQRRVMDADWAPLASSAVAFDFGFHGQFLDGETGYYNYGYRYYSPQIGRWLSRDPIGERGGRNLYRFVGNNGIRGLDYLGLALSQASPPESTDPEFPRSSIFWKNFPVSNKCETGCDCKVWAEFWAWRQFHIDAGPQPTELRPCFKGCFTVVYFYQCPGEPDPVRSFDHIGCLRGIYINNHYTIIEPVGIIIDSYGCESVRDRSLTAAITTHLNSVNQFIAPSDPTVSLASLTQYPELDDSDPMIKSLEGLPTCAHSSYTKSVDLPNI